MSTVSIPRFTIALALAIALAAPVVAFAQSRPLQATPQQVADWQKEIEHAKAKRSGGFRVTLSGLGITAGGMAIARHALACSYGLPSYVNQRYVNQSCEGRLATGEVMYFGGLVLASVGGGRVHDASLELKWLDAHGPAPLADADWKRERDEALRRRTSGRRIQAIGLGAVAAGGAGMLAAGARCDDDCFGPFMLSLITLGAGAGISQTGWQMSHDAALRMQLLDRHPPAAPLPSPAPGRERSGLFVSVGPRTSVTWNLSW